MQRFSSLFASIYIANKISPDEYGLFTYAYSVISLFIPFLGGGLNHSLLYFGSLTKNKNKLFQFSIRYGIYFNIIICIVILLSINIITYRLQESKTILLILLAYLFMHYFHMIVNNYFRINEKNQWFSYNNLLRSVLFIIFLIITVEFFGVYGYIFALIIAPIFSLYYVLKSYKVNYIQQKNITKKIKYGFNVGIGSLASQLILLSDNIVIANIISDPESIAVYKVASIIPLGLLFIPSSFLTTDFVIISKNSKNEIFIKNYFNNFFKLFISVAIVVGVFLYYFSNLIFELLFKEFYSESIEIFKILLLGVLSAFFLRSPLGYIFNAIGKAHINVKISYFLLIVNLFLSIILTNNFGIKGAAFATVFTFWIGGLCSLSVFIYLFYIKTKNN